MTNPAAAISRERRDIVSGEVMDEARLIRFVAGPGAVVAPDVARKLPGRGLWVAADRASVVGIGGRRRDGRGGPPRDARGEARSAPPEPAARAALARGESVGLDAVALGAATLPIERFLNGKA